MLGVRDIAWLAGLIEGEGCFTYSGGSGCYTPVISIAMTDRDVVDRAGQLLGALRVLTRKRPERPTHKQAYRVDVYGARAAGWMMTLYPLLGERRQARVRQLIEWWRTSTREKPGPIRLAA